MNGDRFHDTIACHKHPHAASDGNTVALGDSASELGGGHARHLTVRYLTQGVAPWPEGRFTEATGRDLFAATSQLVHLAGWMAQDEGDTPELRGLAQRYYAYSFRLAAEAGDPELSATALRGLAVQCVDLGYRAEAVQLGEACMENGRHLDNPRAVAYYEATLANAAAQDDDRRMATKHLAMSETAIGKPTTANGDSWASHYSPGRWANRPRESSADWRTAASYRPSAMTPGRRRVTIGR
ncbi:hypothetical protein [Streptomyces gardneri]|uniref:hypothetical protein n=1 Tax=Streptomyces gardneri TaxID=66892 RepID=UPI003F4CF47F